MSGPLPSGVPWSVTRDLPPGRAQVGDRHLKFHEDRDNLCADPALLGCQAEANRCEHRGDLVPERFAVLASAPTMTTRRVGWENRNPGPSQKPDLKLVSSGSHRPAVRPCAETPMREQAARSSAISASQPIARRSRRRSRLYFRQAHRGRCWLGNPGLPD